PTRLAEMRMPTKEVLDVLREHPVMFDASYVVIANSLALKVSGITRDTPNPAGGEIVKGKDGEPNGILKNAAGLLKRQSRSEAWPEAEQLKALEAMLRRYAAPGLTSVVDRSATEAEMGLYDKLRAAGKLPVRVALTWRPDASAPLDTIVASIRKGPRPGGDEWLRRSVYKVTLDGGMTIGTAWQRQPYGPFGAQLYGKTDPSDRGQLFVPVDKLTGILRAARDAGWSLTAHAQGGGAIDTLLDAFEALHRERPLAPTRSHLMHASFQSTEAIARAAKMGILADVQAAWLYHDAPALTKVFGLDGMRLFFPLRSYLNAGVRIAGGSDHMIGHDKNNAVNPYNPFLGIWTSVTRKTSAGQVVGANERITREEALRAYTTGAAYLTGEEAHKGSLETGKLADFVLIDRDYLRCPEDQIREIRPLAVYIGGRKVVP
ncbi:MAG TPA: amidohydrolase, partial [Bryobacteraceae bacterium]|nr:amidohydrolase [Bryobacteraceae bacterium]